MERAAVVEAYWRHHNNATSSVRADRLRADETFWAWEAVEQCVADGAVDVVELLRDLADGAPDEGALAYLGAGPIEGVLSAHGERFGDAIEEAAQLDEKFRTALRCAWFDQSVNPELARRLRRFGEPL